MSASGWVLVIHIFSLTTGHGTAYKEYRSEIQLPPFQTEEDCVKVKDLLYFHAYPRLSDLSYDRMEAECVRPKAPAQPISKPRPN